MVRQEQPSRSYIRGYRHGWLDAKNGHDSIISRTWPTWGDLPDYSTAYSDGHFDATHGQSAEMWRITELGTELGTELETELGNVTPPKP